MYLYGIALNKTITIGANHTDGSAIFDATKNTSFTGAFGHVMINSKADRSTRFVAQRILQSGNLETFLFLSRPFADDDIRVTNVTGTTDWGTPGNVPINDTPACGFSNELCVLKASDYLLCEA
uniref:Uncharacterized protein n=1 Tax=Romanomermis culicivorax TaxID=13658 RepID=A0A915K6F2_ROMCU